MVPWNPDPSWERDALVRVNAVLGPPTRTHTVYEHLDVMTHPLGVHLNEAVATSFWVSMNPHMIPGHEGRLRPNTSYEMFSSFDHWRRSTSSLKRTAQRANGRSAG